MDEERLMDLQELAHFLRVRPSWLYARTRRGGPDFVKPVRLGKFLRWRREDVERWLVEQGMGKTAER